MNAEQIFSELFSVWFSRAYQEERIWQRIPNLERKFLDTLVEQGIFPGLFADTAVAKQSRDVLYARFRDYHNAIAAGRDDEAAEIKRNIKEMIDFMGLGSQSQTLFEAAPVGEELPEDHPLTKAVSDLGRLHDSAEDQTSYMRNLVQQLRDRPIEEVSHLPFVQKQLKQFMKEIYLKFYLN